MIVRPGSNVPESAMHVRKEENLELELHFIH